MQNFTRVAMVVTAALASNSAYAQIKATVVWSRIYEAIDSPEELAKGGTPDKPARTIDGTNKFLRQTNRIPAEMGIKFGLAFKVQAPPGVKDVPLAGVWTFPPPGLRDPETGKVYRTFRYKSRCKVDTSCEIGYGIDSYYELVPGPWTLTIWHGKKHFIRRVYKMDELKEKIRN